MGSDTPAAPAPLPLGRLAGVGLVVFLANAALLVLQLVSGRLLAPFVGSSLETWTSVIGVFLTGIALGNALGGRLADRSPTPRTLATLLVGGAAAALWMVAFSQLLAWSGAYRVVPLGPRIPLLAFALCLPAGFALSLLTPLAIKLALPDVTKAGRVAGLVFALSTLGCLLGNYLTGFVLMKAFTINTLVYLTAGGLAATALVALAVLRGEPGEPGASATGAGVTPVADAPGSPGAPGGPPINPHAFSDIRVAFAVVFLSSFGGMTLEITASRVLAEHLGVSLFTWTGIIGVMLAGTALGNFTGGVVADRVNRPGSRVNPRLVLAGTLVLAGAVSVLLLLARVVVRNRQVFDDYGPITQVVGWTFSLFFLPMFALGMVSPQVIRLAVPDVAHAGRVAGRVYAWSTAGAILGTFAAGYVLLSALGMNNTVLLVALVVLLASLAVAKVADSAVLLYLFSAALGGVVGGFILDVRHASDPTLVAQVESNYYTIKVIQHVRHVGDDAAGKPVYARTDDFLDLHLDHLLHSSVDPEHPDKLHYTHEYVQMEFLRGAWARDPAARVLVIGGGGYTFPRYAMEVAEKEKRADTRLDVVEIDPAVTRVARRYLGLKDYPGMHVTHMDGRQFVAERVPPGTYDLVIQDAVNDLSVPSHLLTKEYNDAVKRAMKPGGVYLLTVIDAVEYGQLWRAAIHTLRETYPAENVALLTPDDHGLGGRQVYVIYASDRKLDLRELRDALWGQLEVPKTVARSVAVAVGGAAAGGPPGLVLVGGGDQTAGHARQVFRTREVPAADIKEYLEAEPRIVLTDQYAPVDNLMADVFRRRNPPRRPGGDGDE